MAGTGRTPSWRALLKGWEEQQEGFNRVREQRFAAMLDVLEATMPRRFTALDLGCGPGSLSVRILRRFPGARVVAVDNDPVTVRIGRGVFGSYGGRLTWVQARLASPGWTDALPQRKFDAALSTTALHWLTRSELATLARDLSRLLRRGGVFLNGDHLPWGPETPGLVRLAAGVSKVRRKRLSLKDDLGLWQRWWETAESVPALRPYFEERARRSAAHPRHADVPLSAYVVPLRRAGFRDIDVVWQVFGTRVLYARR